MTGRIRALAAGAAFALYAAMGAAAFAQGAPPPGGPSGAMTMRGHGPESPAEHAQRLRDLLQLKPAQEPALQAFIGALETAHRNAEPTPPAGPPPATTPERLARMQEMMARRQAAATTVIDATRRFYDQLDPAQKRAFDALPMPAMHARFMAIMGGPPGMDGKGPPPER